MLGAAEMGRHSEKPAHAHTLIERMYPNARRLELFARGAPRTGWTAWGNIPFLSEVTAT